MKFCSCPLPQDPGAGPSSVQVLIYGHKSRIFIFVPKVFLHEQEREQLWLQDFFVHGQTNPRLSWA